MSLGAYKRPADATRSTGNLLLGPLMMPRRSTGSCPLRRDKLDVCGAYCMAFRAYSQGNKMLGLELRATVGFRW